MELFITLLCAIALPQALTHPFQNDSHKTAEIDERAAYNGTTLKHDTHPMLEREISPAYVGVILITDRRRF
jgi:hypothetical protein